MSDKFRKTHEHYGSKPIEFCLVGKDHPNLKQLTQEKIDYYVKTLNDLTFPDNFVSHLQQELNVDDNLMRLYIDEYKKFLFLICVSKVS